MENNSKSLTQLKHLQETVKQYHEHKAEVDKHNKIVDKYKVEIKKLLKEMNMLEYEFDDYKVKLTESTTSSFDNEKLVQKLKDLGADDVLKTIEVPNEQELEDALYNGRILPTQLADCQINKVVEMLKVTKK